MKAEEIIELFEQSCTRYGFQDGDKEFYKKSEVIRTAISLVNHLELSLSKAPEKEEEKIYNIEFGNHLLAEVKIDNNYPEVLRAVDGWGQKVDIKQINIKTPPKN